ncbi:MAG: nitroreductase family protein [Synergistaceae bacterium]|nr:nitroreductase family protein [Synergistaceae bacterium]
MSDYKNIAAIENILSRRSIRRFDASRPVPADMVELLVECACAAPSSHNYRPWHFVIVDKREILDEMAEVHPYGKMLTTAALAIAVCSEIEREGSPVHYWEEDCAAAMENILLAANASGLGSVWIGARHGDNGLEGRIKLLLNVPEEIALLGVAVIGWPMETKDPHKGIDAHSLHLNKW